MLTPQTKIPKLAQAVGLQTDLYLKREDLHPYGSHKGRSIPPMIEKYVKDGWLDFVISSSGNAALAAVCATNKYNKQNPSKNLTLKIFVGENIGKDKLNILSGQNGGGVELRQVKNPRQSAFQSDKDGHAKLLRQSTDDSALSGYFELAKELAQIKNLSAVFIPTSSGTTAQGLFEGFKLLGLCPQIHIAQTANCHPIASPFVSQTVPPSSVSIASAIVDKVARRKNSVLKAIKNSRGNGWIASDEEIKTAMKLSKQTSEIEISPNSALAVAGLRQALATGWKFDGPVVCLITGR